MEALVYFAILSSLPLIAETVALTTGFATFIYAAISIANFYQDSFRSKSDAS